MTTLSIIQRKSGTYSLILKRPDSPAQLWRSKIPTREEAQHRARIVADLCGYRVKEVRP
jgi:K+/H+ antiporter YhaU regulatory subunit KhtT